MALDGGSPEIIRIVTGTVTGNAAVDEPVRGAHFMQRSWQKTKIKFGCFWANMPRLRLLKGKVCPCLPMPLL
jgi:hypothetical protein